MTHSCKRITRNSTELSLSGPSHDYLCQQLGLVPLLPVHRLQLQPLWVVLLPRVRDGFDEVANLNVQLHVRVIHYSEGGKKITFPFFFICHLTLKSSNSYFFSHANSFPSNTNHFCFLLLLTYKLQLRSIQRESLLLLTASHMQTPLHSNMNHYCFSLLLLTCKPRSIQTQIMSASALPPHTQRRTAHICGDADGERRRVRRVAGNRLPEHHGKWLFGFMLSFASPDSF